jgi:hypothetical protein
MARIVFRFLNRSGSEITYTGSTGTVTWERTPPQTINDGNENAAIFVATAPTPGIGNSVVFSFGYQLPGSANPPNGVFQFDVTVQHDQINIVSDPPGQHVVNSQIAGEFPDISYSATLE